MSIINGDCLEEMKKLSDESIDIIITSPPYEKLRAYNGYSFDFEGVAKEIFRIMNKGNGIQSHSVKAKVQGAYRRS